MKYKHYLPLLYVAGIVAVFQLLCSILGMEFFLTQVIMSSYYSLVVLGLCLLMGYAGQISLGHAGFFAIGGYTSAFLTTVNLQPWANLGMIRICKALLVVTERTDIYGNPLLSFAPWFAFCTAILLTVLIAFLIGIPVLKLKGHYLAMATLGFGIIIQTIVVGTRFLGEADGITGVPPFYLLPGLPVTGKAPMRILNYYIAWLVILAALVAAINLIHSRIGRAFKAIHSSEEAARAMGVNTPRYKLYVFVLSAVYAAIGGIFLTHYNAGIGPSEAGIFKSVRYVALVAAGGMDNIWSSLLMGVVLNFLSLRGFFGTYDDIIFGLILIAMMLFAPKGLLRAGILSVPLEFLKRKLGKKAKDTNGKTTT